MKRFKNENNYTIALNISFDDSGFLVRFVKSITETTSNIESPYTFFNFNKVN